MNYNFKIILYQSLSIRIQNNIALNSDNPSSIALDWQKLWKVDTQKYACIYANMFVVGVNIIGFAGECTTWNDEK